MLEITILGWLMDHLTVPVYLEDPSNSKIKSYVVFEKTSSSKENHLNSDTFAFQSYGESMYEAAKLNEEVKQTLENMIELNQVASVKLNSDYNFTDTSKKKYRYQCVFDFKY